jgi:hypothetical protein
MDDLCSSLLCVTKCVFIGCPTSSDSLPKLHRASVPQLSLSPLPPGIDSLQGRARIELAVLLSWDSTGEFLLRHLKIL